MCACMYLHKASEQSIVRYYDSVFAYRSKIQQVERACRNTVSVRR